MQSSEKPYLVIASQVPPRNFEFESPSVSRVHAPHAVQVGEAEMDGYFDICVHVCSLCNGSGTFAQFSSWDGLAESIVLHFRTRSSRLTPPLSSRMLTGITPAPGCCAARVSAQH